MRARLAGVILVVLLSGSAMAAGVKLQLSGEGAVNDSTIRAGFPVSVNVVLENDSMRTGMTLGFKITSEQIKTVTHVVDSGHGLNARGDVKGYNGFADASIWDLYGMMVVETDWDGTLPELLGFGAVGNKQKYLAHAWEKKLSFDIVIDQPGTLVIDSAFFPPGGKWLYASPPGTVESHEPDWYGPYKFQVIK
jgi:hypothetical protein